MRVDFSGLRPDLDATPIEGTTDGITIATSDYTETHRRLDTNSVATPITVTGDGGLQIWVDQDASGSVTLEGYIGAIALPSGEATYLLVSPQVIVDRVWMVAILTAIP